MSKDQEKTIKLNVETVDNLRNLLDYIPTTIKFWKLRNVFPLNLICDYCENIAYELNKNVSVSHINDK